MSWLPRVALAGLVVTALLVNSVPASADDGSTCPDPASCVTGGDGVINVGGTGSLPVVGGPGAPGGGGGAQANHVVSSFAPACSGNTRTDTTLLCVGATGVCPAPDQILYWRWTAVLSPIGALLPPGWTRSPRDFCLSPQAAGASPDAVIAATVESEFTRLVVFRGSVATAPRDRTLVRFPTDLSTDARTYALPAVTILGRTVRITATPASIDWTFGDGEAQASAGAALQHAYTHSGAVSPHVTVTWSGTYTVDGGPSRDVVGTATTTGPGTPLRVVQARSELVGG